MYTLQLEGGHVLLVIQISETYATNCCSGAVEEIADRDLLISFIHSIGLTDANYLPFRNALQ